MFRKQFSIRICVPSAFWVKKSGTAKGNVRVEDGIYECKPQNQQITNLFRQMYKGGTPYSPDADNIVSMRHMHMKCMYCLFELDHCTKQVKRPLNRRLFLGAQTIWTPPQAPNVNTYVPI